MKHSANLCLRIWSLAILHGYKELNATRGAPARIWSLAILHGYKALSRAYLIYTGFGAWLFYTGTKLSVVQNQIALDLGPNDFT